MKKIWILVLIVYFFTVHAEPVSQQRSEEEKKKSKDLLNTRHYCGLGLNTSIEGGKLRYKTLTIEGGIRFKCENFFTEDKDLQSEYKDIYCDLKFKAICDDGLFQGRLDACMLMYLGDFVADNVYFAVGYGLGLFMKKDYELIEEKLGTESLDISWNGVFIKTEPMTIQVKVPKKSKTDLIHGPVFHIGIEQHSSLWDISLYWHDSPIVSLSWAYVY